MALVSCTSNLCPTEVAQEVIAALAASGKHEYIAVLSRKVFFGLVPPQRFDLADLWRHSPVLMPFAMILSSVKA